MDSVCCGYLDGYTAKGYLAAVERLTPALRFEHRPTTQDERNGYLDQIEGKSNREAGKVAVKLLAQKLVRWDLKDAKGAAVALSEKTLALLHPDLHARLFAVVLGTRAPDEDPEASAEEEAARAEDTFRSAA